jgi:hypothetical protein
MHTMKQSGRLTPALRVLTPFAIMAGVELAIFWPLIQRLSTALHDRFDTMLNTWILTWQARELIRAPLAVFNAPIFHPLPNMLALSEIIWPAAPMTVPILAASGNPLLVYNLTFLGTVFLADIQEDTRVCFWGDFIQPSLNMAGITPKNRKAVAAKCAEQLPIG